MYKFFIFAAIASAAGQILRFDRDVALAGSYGTSGLIDSQGGGLVGAHAAIIPRLPIRPRHRPGLAGGYGVSGLVGGRHIRPVGRHGGALAGSYGTSGIIASPIMGVMGSKRVGHSGRNSRNG